MNHSAYPIAWTLVLATLAAPAVLVGQSRPADDLMSDAQAHTYRQVDGAELKLYVFQPPQRSTEPRPAIVFFFGGGWLRGTPAQFAPQCRLLAQRGLVTITADYRVHSRQRAMIVDAVADAQWAVRWVREHANDLGIDPKRIAAGGGSAGGHLAAATAMVKDFTGQDSKTGFLPDALILFNPALDLRRVAARERSDGRGIKARLGADAGDLSPAAHLRGNLPPTIIFHGKNDQLIAYEQVEAFVAAMTKAGNRCELVGFEGAGHAFFNQEPAFDETMRSTERFLASLGWLNGPATRPAAGAYLDAVRTFADNVLRHGRDTYGSERTALLADGVNIDTHEPAIWRLPEQQAADWKMPRAAIISNLASQQNLFRTLAGLSQLTGDDRYRQAAAEATAYGFAHLQHQSGLLQWGGHTAVDLESSTLIGEARTAGEAGKHELKRHYPFYELMWEVNPAATRRFIDSFWANHVLDWSTLDFNRHGPWAVVPGSPWDHQFAGGPVPFVGQGLTFSNTASDLFYAAAMVGRLTGDERPLAWAKRLARRYVEARHPVTGLGADNFSEEKTRRFVQQFGPEFGERCTEATVTSLYGNRYRQMAICQLRLSQMLGAAGDDFRQWAVEDLTAYARHCYDPATNSFRATLIDGTVLSPADVKRPAYVTPEQFAPRAATAQHFWAYALAASLDENPLLWKTARSIAAGLDLGEFGERSGEPGRLKLDTKATDANLIFALIDVHARWKDPAWLELARRIADNLLAAEFHQGFFTAGPEVRMCRFDTISPLALLHLHNALAGGNTPLAPYSSGSSYFHCPFDGLGRTYDNQAIYSIPKVNKPLKAK